MHHQTVSQSFGPVRGRSFRNPVKEDAVCKISELIEVCVRPTLLPEELLFPDTPLG